MIQRSARPEKASSTGLGEAAERFPASARPERPLRAVDVFLRYLQAEGVTHVFGIVGGLVYPFFKAVEQDASLTLVHVRHEENAAFMADGFARTTRRLAVCAATSGPGATNLITGVACAYADGVPMLVLTGQAASRALGKGAAQETPREGIDIVDMFRPITKYSAMVTTADAIGHHLRRALRQALTGRFAPVHLNVPVDLWERTVNEQWFEPSTYRPETRGFDRRAVERAADVLLAAARPVLFVGSGVAASGAEASVRVLAELLPARVATSPRAKGAFPEDHRLSLGVFGNAGHRAARDVLLGNEVDVLFAIGTSLGETSTLGWTKRLDAGRALVQLDIDPEHIGRNYPVDVALVGDAEATLLELIDGLKSRMRDRSSPASRWRESTAMKRGDARYDDAELRTSDRVPVSPQRWRADLAQVLPDDAVIFSDIGGHMLFNLHHLCIGSGQRFVINLGFGAMGHGTIAPIGAALAMPGRPVFALVGDGCFMMNGMDLMTAAEHDLPILWIVENNNMHGITWHCSRLLGGGTPLRAPVYRKPVSIAALARAMGIDARIVDRPGQIEDAVRALRRVRAPGVIEVRVDPSAVPPLGERVEMLAGFIEP